MKKLLLLTILLSWLGAWAQNQSDMIFLKNGHIIKDCKIYEIKPDVICYYQGDSYFEKEAKAYVRGGLFYSLEAENRYFKTQLAHLPDSIKELEYRDKTYEFYFKKHHKATVTRNVGIGFVAAGVLSGSFGYYLLGVNEAVDDDVDPNISGLSDNQAYGIGLMIMGGISIGIGTPLLIAGQTQKANNRRKMKKMFPNNAVLSAGITNNGVGFSLRF